MTALPVLSTPPAVGTSSDHRYLVIKWPQWVANVTGTGTGPVVSYTLQGLERRDTADWHNLVTMEPQQLRTDARPATAAGWFAYTAEGGLVFVYF